MKCTFIVQFNKCCLKLKRLKQKKSQLTIFYFCLYSLYQVFNDIIDNQKTKVCVPYPYVRINDKIVIVYIKLDLVIDYRFG